MVVFDSFVFELWIFFWDSSKLYTRPMCVDIVATTRRDCAIEMSHTTIFVNTEESVGSTERRHNAVGKALSSATVSTVKIIPMTKVQIMITARHLQTNPALLNWESTGWTTTISLLNAMNNWTVWVNSENHRNKQDAAKQPKLDLQTFSCFGNVPWYFRSIDQIVRRYIAHNRSQILTQTTVAEKAFPVRCV